MQHGSIALWTAARFAELRCSAARLGLQTGKQAFALVKASTIVLVGDSKDVIFSARNNLNGTVTEVHEGAVNAEVIVELTNGGTVAAIVTNASARALELKPGSPVSAIFKGPSVILGVSVSTKTALSNN